MVDFAIFIFGISKKQYFFPANDKLVWITHTLENGTKVCPQK